MIPERLSPDRFAAALAACLQRVVPDGFSVRTRGHAVGVYDPTWWGDSEIADIVAEEDGRSIINRVETAAWAIINFAQDAVMESTREPWPGGPAGGAMPETRVIGEQLHMWFGNERDPVLRLQPVDLTELGSGAA